MQSILQYNGYTFHLASSENEKDEARTLMYEAWSTPRYGLKDSSYLTDDDIDRGTHIYFLAHDSKNRIPVGTFRLIPDFNLHRFNNIEEDALKQWGNKENRLVRSGAYYSSAVTSRTARAEVFLGLWSSLIRYCTNNKVDGIYAASLPQQLKRLRAIGFKQIGSSFTMDGWYSQSGLHRLYIPILFDMKSRPLNIRSSRFRESRVFWKIVYKLIPETLAF